MEKFPPNPEDNIDPELAADMGILPDQPTEPRFLEDDHFDFLSDPQHLGTSIGEGFRCIDNGQHSITRYAEKSTYSEVIYTKTEVNDKPAFVSSFFKEMVARAEHPVDRINLLLAADFVNDSALASHFCLSRLVEDGIRKEAHNVFSLILDQNNTSAIVSGEDIGAKFPQVSSQLLDYVAGKSELDMDDEDLGQYADRKLDRIFSVKLWGSLSLLERTIVEDVNDLLEDLRDGVSNVDMSDVSIVLDSINSFMRQLRKDDRNAQAIRILQANLALAYDDIGNGEQRDKCLEGIYADTLAWSHIYQQLALTDVKRATFFLLDNIAREQDALKVITQVDPDNTYVKARNYMSNLRKQDQVALMAKNGTVPITVIT